MTYPKGDIYQHLDQVMLLFLFGSNQPVDSSLLNSTHSVSKHLYIVNNSAILLTPCCIGEVYIISV